MSKIMCIIDGMNDSTFCVEDYPSLASFPEREFIKTVPDGFNAETLPCVLSLLGVNPPQNIRGYIEALGAGKDVNNGDLIFRGSWVLVNDEGVCVGFCDAPHNIPKLEQMRYIPLQGYKSLLIFPHCEAYIDAIKPMLPFELFGKRIDEYIYPDIPLIKNTLMKLNSIDSNCMMFPWSASIVKALPNMPKSAAVCGTNVVKGIAKALNMHLVTMSDMTGDTDTNLIAKLHYTLALAKKYPFVLLHIGGCDEASHRMQRKEKHEFLSNVDKIVISKLLQSSHTVEVVSDHGSDPITGKHTDEEQPFFVSKKNNERLCDKKS